LELQKKNERNEIKKVTSKEDVLRKIQERRTTDDKRYLKYYNINIREEKNYDFVLDTTNLNPQEVFEKVMGFINSNLDAKKPSQKNPKHHF
jgi:cytidylate kinase